MDKILDGVRISESTRTADLDEAEAYLARRVAEVRATGIAECALPGERLFVDAAIRYLEEQVVRKGREGHFDDRSVRALDHAMAAGIGELPLRMVHQGTLAPYVAERLKVNAPGTVNRDLAVIRRVLNLAARLWRDNHGRPWLDTAPLIQLVPDKNPRRPYVLTWDEQERFLRAIEKHWLRDAVILGVNCGAREGELCALRWDWAVERGDRMLFVLPGPLCKNGQDRVLVPNAAAQSVLRERRLLGTPTVLAYANGKPITRINGQTWAEAWKCAGLPKGREYRRGPHNLRHTYGHRLRAAGVSREMRADLLGHKRQDITTHYSEADIDDLIQASDKALDTRLAAPLRVVTRNLPYLSPVTSAQASDFTGPRVPYTRPNRLEGLPEACLGCLFPGLRSKRKQPDATA